MNRIEDLLHGDCETVNGKTIGENISGAIPLNGDIIRPRDRPLYPEGGIAVLRGNLAPNGAVIKQSAASQDLLQHRGRAYVFETRAEMLAEVEREDLPVDRNTILVMRNCGPKGAPGFPEWGHIPMPRKLLNEGVTDIVRISDARMSGTSYGTVVLHVTPESAVGGPLALVQTGDEILLDVPGRKLELLVPAQELDRRARLSQPPPRHYDRGYGRLFLDHVTQADLGCDFDFLSPDYR